MESKGQEQIGLEYWLQWHIPVCALIFIIPSVAAVRILKTGQSQPLKSTDLWLPCWRNLNPLWLLFFRAFAFFSMAFVLYHVFLVLGGAMAFYFYTQWTFGLVMVYFALVSIISARGCWIYSKKKKPFPEDRESDEFLKKDSEGSRYRSTASSEAKETKGTTKLQSRHSQEEIEWKTGFLEHLVQAIYQTCAGAVMLTDIVFWFLLVPFVLGDNFRITLLIGSIHSVNAIFLILDSALNSLPFSWYGIVYFVLWSASYVVFQWILHACCFTWWPYPFLDLSTPWAPLWYFALALVHIPCYGIYVLIMKAKGSIFSRMFPSAFVRTVNTTRRNSLEKKKD